MNRDPNYYSNSVLIKHLGKFTFYLFFFLGSLCFFGYLFFREIEFAVAGFYLLIAGVFLHILLISLFLLTAIIRPSLASDCLEAAVLLAFNFFTAIVYTGLGITML